MTNKYSVNVDALESLEKTVFAGPTVLPEQELQKALKAWGTENIGNGRVDVYKYDDEGALKLYAYIQDGKPVRAQ